MVTQSDYAVVYKRPVQPMMSADDPGRRRGDVGKFDHQRGADHAGFLSEIPTRSRQSPDGTLDSSEPVSARTNPTVEPPGVHVTSSSDFRSDEQRLGVKPSSSSSHEHLASTSTVRSSDVVSGVPQNLLEPTRTEPQGGSENTDLQVSVVVE